MITILVRKDFVTEFHAEIESKSESLLSSIPLKFLLENKTS